ncbi:MAG: hypothetical protein KA419_05310 [Acidobacteria bacterium]|nr:hypothetical protein [Acidobacteriota bacterium]
MTPDPTTFERVRKPPVSTMGNPGARSCVPRGPGDARTQRGLHRSLLTDCRVNTLRIGMCGLAAGLVLAAAGLLLGGCGGKGAGEAESELAQPSTPIDGTRYFPMTEGSRWSYVKRQALDEGEEDTSGQSFVAKAWEAPDGSPGCMLDDPGRGILNAFTLYFAKTSRGIVSYLGLFGIGKTKFDTPMLALPARIAARDVWAWSGTTKGVAFKVVSKLQGLETLTVPAGTFPCIRIRHDLDHGGWLVHWYAQDVGLVKADAFVPSHGGLPSSRHSLELEKYFISKN